MRLVTDNGSDVTITTDNQGQEVIMITAGHGKVEVTIPKWGTPDGTMVTQVFQAISEVTMATVETSTSRYHEVAFLNTHNTEVIR